MAKNTGARYGLLLTHGAGSDASSSQLMAIERAVTSATNVAVRRVDFPYRKAGRKMPDREPVLLEAVRDEAEAFRKSLGIPAQRLFLGGRSMGGRMCSLAVAHGLPAAGLALVSYPLHPPGRPEKLRVDHFRQIGVPCLFVSGTRDAFGTRDEFAKYLRRITSGRRMKWIEGGDHGLAKYDTEVAAAVTRWLSTTIASLDETNEAT